MTSGSDLERALEPIIERVVRRVLGSVGASEYSSDHLPAGIRTRKAFAKICSSGAIPRAVQDGRRGAWRCSREAWHAARARHPQPALHLVSSGPGDDEIVAAALRAAGCRAR